MGTMKESRKLSRTVIDRLTPKPEPYRIWDTAVPQLHLRVQPSGVKSWNVQLARNTPRALGKWPGVTVEAAQAQARKLLAQVGEEGTVPVKSTDTVADACRDYVEALRKEGRDGTAADAERRFERTVYADRIGKIRLTKLTQDDVEDWRDRVERGDLAPLPTRKGRPPSAKPLQRATVNRIRTTLVAALNRAVSRRKVTPDRIIEWANVKPYEKAGRRRELYLDREQRRALLDAAPPSLRAVMECIALTGCRPGDPALVLRRDYDGRTGSVTFRSKGHERTIPLSPAARALFDRLAKSKLPAAHLFTREDGMPWQPHDWRAGVKAAAAEVNLPPETVLYTLRHSWITDAIVGGMDPLTVSKLVGTSIGMIQDHYGHLAQGAARDKLAAIQFL